MEKEIWARNIAFVGEVSFDKIRKAKVCVVGLGGVGSNAVQALARSGVGHLTLIDFDEVSVSSLNRHCCATVADVGKKKADVLSTRMMEWCNGLVQCEPVVSMLTPENISKMVPPGRFDFVLDCIDNVVAKVALLAHCYHNNIPVVSSMGAGAKLDPSQIVVADLFKSHSDPLAAKVRREVKKRGVGQGIRVVYSPEKAQVPLVMGAESDAAMDSACAEFGHSPNTMQFRRRILPVMMAVPAAFGFTCASVVISALSGESMCMAPVIPKSTREYYEKIYSFMCSRERTQYEQRQNPPVFIPDIAQVVECFGNRSAVSNKAGNLVLIRWNREKSTVLSNLIPVTREEAKTHDSVSYDNLSTIYSAEVMNTINEKLSALSQARPNESEAKRLKK